MRKHGEQMGWLKPEYKPVLKEEETPEPYQSIEEPREGLIDPAKIPF